MLSATAASLPCSLTDKGTMEAGAMLRQEHRPIAGRTGSQNWALILYIGPWSLEATFSLPEASLPRDALFILVTHGAEHQRHEVAKVSVHRSPQLCEL